MKPYRLFALPSAWTGAARLVDLGGVFDEYNASETEEEADARALASDWAHVGRDLYRAAQGVLGTLKNVRS